MEPDRDFGTWNGAVEYSYAVMETVRAQAVEGLNSFAHGGLEIGGVLYGERRGDLVRVMASQELECEHAFGPGFVLSPAEEARLRELMKPRNGMRAVGWYCSHTRSGVVLNANDCAILERFFPERGSVVLLVKPMRFGPAEATFHLQGCASPGPHFSVLVAKPSQMPRPSEKPVAPAKSVLRPAPLTMALMRLPAPVLPPAAARVWDQARQTPWVRWVGLGVCFAVVAAWSISISPRPQPRVAAAATGMGLQVYAIANRQLRIEWDRSAVAVRSADSATVEIIDGGAKFSLPLTSAQLRSSSLTYGQQSDVVDIHLKLATGAEESVKAVMPSLAPAVPSLAVPSRSEVDVPRAAAAPPAVPAVVAPSASTVEPARRQSTPAARKTFMLANVVVKEERPLPDVSLPEPPVAPGGPLVTVPSKALLSLPAALMPVVRTPRSGRMIWTGSVGRSGVVEFHGNSVNTGSLSGNLPGGPAKLSVFPAEFKRDNLIVYVADAARNDRTEAPGPTTGWNRLLAEWDPDRVKQLRVLEAPSANNQFARLVVRNEARSCKAIVVEWHID